MNPPGLYRVTVLAPPRESVEPGGVYRLVQLSETGHPRSDTLQ